MKLRVLILFLTLPLVLVVVESCDLFCGGGSCCGSDFSPSFFEVDGVDLLSVNSSLPTRYDSINIFTQFDRRDIVQNFYKSSLFINEASACSPPEFPTSKDTLKDIRVIANSDYNLNYQTGASLNEIISIGVISDENGRQSLTDYLAGDLSLIADNFAWIEYVFNFTEAPSDTIEHSFTIEFVFDDKVITATTDILTITQ